MNTETEALQRMLSAQQQIRGTSIPGSAGGDSHRALGDALFGIAAAAAGAIGPLTAACEKLRAQRDEAEIGRADWKRIADELAADLKRVREVIAAKQVLADERLIAERDELAAALRELVSRCDGDEGVRADGSNIQTMQAHAVLTKLEGGE